MAISRDDIKRKQNVGRRGFIVSAGLGAVGAAAAIAAAKPSAARAAGGGPDAGDEEKYSCTDSDTGTSADPVGSGDRCNDLDTGCGADPVR